MTTDYSEITEALKSILQSNSSVLIVIKGSPDPDVIAASYFLQEMGKLFGSHCTILSETRVSLPQNQAMISQLKIHLLTRIPDLAQYNGYAVFDFQSPEYNAVSEKLPCLIHIDHHGISESTLTPKYQLINQAVNSVSTILAGVYLLIKDEFSESVSRSVATALCYGILSDTDNLSIGSEIDKRQYNSIKPYADSKLLETLTQMPYSEETLTLISKALIGSVYYKNWLIAGIGYVPAEMRDSLAITADFLLQREDVTTVIVFALVESSSDLVIDASFRSKESRLDLNRFIKKITPNGGGRRYKGAFQLSMNYFKHTSDKVRLWDTVKESTIENIKRGRDSFRFDEVKSFFTDLRDHITDIFSDSQE